MSQKSSSLAYDVLRDNTWEDDSQDFVPELSLIVNKRSVKLRGEAERDLAISITGSLSVSF